MLLTDLGVIMGAAKAIRADPSYPQDPYFLEALRLAIRSAAEGNFGVGAVLVNETGTIIQRGRNRVFYPRFRSELHAEMDLMTRFEMRAKGPFGAGKLAVFSSLEPCPMCLARLISSGVGAVYYAARDELGGMAENWVALPPAWVELARGRVIGLGACSSRLRELCKQVFRTTGAANDVLLKERAAAPPPA